MSTAQLIAVDQILSVLVVAVWGAAAGFCLAVTRRPDVRRTALIAAALVAAAIVCTGVRVVTTVALAGAGWWFAAEKVIVALPLLVPSALTAAVLTLPRLLRGRGSEERLAVALPPFCAAYGAVAGVLATNVMSYPVTAAGVIAIVALFGGGCGITWAVLTGRRLDRTRLAGAGVLVLALVWAVAGSWSGTDSVHAGHGATAFGVPVDQLLGPSVPDAKRFTLTVRETTLRLPSGATADAWAFNGQVPGPTLRVRQGDVVEVTLRDELPGGQAVTIHWHGYDVPSGEDGVPGVTQNAVKPGETRVYRFRADQAGTYWYHSHQNSSIAVARGLFGLLIVDPAEPGKQDHTVALHTFAGHPTLSLDGAAPSDRLVPATIPPGSPVRLRVVNTDSKPRIVGLTGVPYTLAAVDGGDVPGATSLGGQRLTLAAGGRYDLAFTMPSGPVRLYVDGHPGLLAGTGALNPPTGPLLDITQYGSRVPVPARFDQELTWVLDQSVAIADGLPRLAQTVNGKAWPNIPTPLVRQGQTIKITVVNRGRETHPMHPHGHHVQILSRDGRPATGLSMDTFDVAPGEVWVVALKADNPGMWMSHCHDLAHAAQGMEFHLAYEGITTPFDVTGVNHPA